jgi:uncharacterized protein (TIGR00661 family)
MRILYGAFAQGQGHFSKAAVLVPLLEARGHDVWVVSSGPEQPPAGYHFRRHSHFAGLAYVAAGGRVRFGRTAWKWLRELPRILHHLTQLRRLVRDFHPDLIVSDFEPLTASPLLRPDCEVVALSRQAALIDPAIELPPEADFERKLTRSVLRMFTAGADRVLGYHYAPASHHCVPPIRRSDVGHARADAGDHVLVYNQGHTADGGSAGELIRWAGRNACRVRAYGFAEPGPGTQGFVEFRPPSGRGFLDDLRTARAVITTAGFTTPVEALLLRKPVAVVALPGQWEQRVNAFHLEQTGLAAWFSRWDYSRLLELPVPDVSGLRDWLSTSPGRVLDFVLAGSADGVPARILEPVPTVDRVPVHISPPWRSKAA